MEKEFCVMKDGNNVDCFRDLSAAINCCVDEGPGAYVVEVHYGEPDGFGDTPELNCETVYVCEGNIK